LAFGVATCGGAGGGQAGGSILLLSGLDGGERGGEGNFIFTRKTFWLLIQLGRIPTVSSK